MITNEHSPKFPDWSTAVYVTVVSPISKSLPDGVSECGACKRSPVLSKTVMASHITVAEERPGSIVTVISDGQVRIGASASGK